MNAGDGEVGAARVAVSSLVNRRLMPFLSRPFRFAQEFGELFAVQGEAGWWRKTVTPTLNSGDCIVYHSRTLDGSQGNWGEEPRVAYIPTFMGASYTRNGVPVSDATFGYPKIDVDSPAVRPH